jgi:Arc/MetJ-type ribon-helix-helix transcriptional regulator
LQFKRFSSVSEYIRSGFRELSASVDTTGRDTEYQIRRSFAQDMMNAARQNFLNIIYVGRHYNLDAKRLSLLEYLDLITEMNNANVKNHVDDFKEV